MATSTKTHYFETFVEESKVVTVLKKFLDDGELCYYRYVAIPNRLGLRKMEGRWGMKIYGVLQYNQRMSKKAVRQMFSSQRVYMAALLTAKRPIVLMLVRLYVVCECYGLSYTDTRCSNTPIGFGGRTTTNEVKYMKPYIKALTHYEDCERCDFSYRDLEGARQICKYKSMLRKKMEKRNMPLFGR
ncbi:Hypothetical predicted protein [Paramuricea clavata]|uniref:Uncharacterized protein n=1 Tax=Paramuricea clavata TaxID=317549 RepID=A0A7D9DA54_PARCT|nr:Hypothetical predicted protein [Paramuricea clavata]